MAEQKPWKMDFDSVEGLKHHNKLDPPGFDSVTARDWVRRGCRGSAMLAFELAYCRLLLGSALCCSAMPQQQQELQQS